MVYIEDETLVPPKTNGQRWDLWYVPIALPLLAAYHLQYATSGATFPTFFNHKKNKNHHIYKIYHIHQSKRTLGLIIIKLNIC